MPLKCSVDEVPNADKRAYLHYGGDGGLYDQKLVVLEPRSAQYLERKSVRSCVSGVR